jgi:Ni,Fe-hydrogenase III small subunit
MIPILKNSVMKGILTRHSEPALCKEIEAIGTELHGLICRRFGRSLYIRQVDTGSCGGCESEIIQANSPVYDLQRFGVSFVASPRHADGLLVTGPVSRNMLLALQRTYEAMAEPKFIITLGDCALDAGLFKGSYYIAGPVKDILPVVMHIPGCPPSPLRIIQSLLSFLQKKEKIQ